MAACQLDGLTASQLSSCQAVQPSSAFPTSQPSSAFRHFTNVTATSPTICRLFADTLSNVSCIVW